jgi:general secretion pathway protein I
MRRQGSSLKGFTLLEILVALAILSGTLVMAYRVMSEAISAEERSERWTAAACLGESMLRDSIATFPDVSETEGRFTGMDNAYAWKKTVKQAMHADAREVDVTVTWKDDDREEKVFLAGIAVK